MVSRGFDRSNWRLLPGSLTHLPTRQPTLAHQLVQHHLYSVKHLPNHRKPTLRTGLRVEVSYDVTMIVETIFERGTPNEHRGLLRLPQPGLLESGQFCVGTIAQYDPDLETYDVIYVSGPYWHDEDISTVGRHAAVYTTLSSRIQRNCC